MAKQKKKSEIKILIVDTHEASRHVIAILLHKLGYKNVLEAGTAIDADTIISNHIHKNDGMASLLGGGPTEICDIDLVILDYNTPPMNGLGYLASLRARFESGAVPVLFTAMKKDKDKLETAMDCGANQSLLKPFTQEKLGSVIMPMLSLEKAPIIKAFDFAAKPKKPALVKPKRKEEKQEPALPESESKGKPVEKRDPAIELSRPKAKPAEKSKSGTGGISFRRSGAGKKYTTENGPTATLVNGVIDGHYHERVDVIGGGENCYWAKQIDGQDRVRLEYLNAKGKSTGMEAKIIPLEQFMYTFYLCEEHGCAILARAEADAKG